MKTGARSDINVTPLIDIVLVLLIIFIVMVPALGKVTKAVLPRTAEDRGPKPPTPLVVSLDGAGKLYLQQEQVSWETLPERLAPALMLQPLNGRKVFLKVDGELSQAYAVRAMDMIRVGSLLARTRTAQNPELGGEDGGDAKVVVSLKKG